MVSKLIFILQPTNNDSELPHQINNILIQKGMLLQLVDLNQKFKDHYTSTAVLVGLYLKLQFDHDRNIMELTEEKRNIGQLIAYSVFDSLSSINFNKYSKNQNKQIIGSMLPLLMDQIFSILIKEQPLTLFENILDELYMGNCLEALNQLQLIEEPDLMERIIKEIPYSEVTKYGSEKKYWIAVMNLYARRIIHLNIFTGLQYLCIDDHVEHKYI